jgi:hypothetical protein
MLTLAKQSCAQYRKVDQGSRMNTVSKPLIF